MINVKSENIFTVFSQAIPIITKTVKCGDPLDIHKSYSQEIIVECIQLRQSVKVSKMIIKGGSAPHHSIQGDAPWSIYTSPHPTEKRRLLSIRGVCVFPPTLEILLGSLLPLHTCESLTWFLTICEQQGKDIPLQCDRYSVPICIVTIHTKYVQRGGVRVKGCKRPLLDNPITSSFPQIMSHL